MPSRYLNLGENRGKRRLWIQGAALTDAGFRPGDQYALLRRGSSLRLRKLTKGEQPQPAEDTRPRKISGKGTLPIADLIGRVVSETFGDTIGQVELTSDAEAGCVLVVGIPGTA